MKYKHLFGPVLSRRLGVSLGIDMMPHKVCTLDCVYCECGKTTVLTTERKEYIPADEIIGELNNYLSEKPDIDFVTFGGSGEPTLNSALGTCIQFVKNTFPYYKVALLTNGTLLYLPEVRNEAGLCDMVLPSLDAVSDNAFSSVNRPHTSLDNTNILNGLIEFSRSYTGILWVEVFIVPGINDTPDELHLFKSALLTIKPTRVQLNSLDRPGTCEWVSVPQPEALQQIAEFFNPLPVEIISRNSQIIPQHKITGIETEETVLTLIRRRPSTIEELSIISGLTINILGEILSRLQNRGEIIQEKISGKLFYRV